MDKKLNSAELLRRSVIELVSTMPVEKITVNMICDNCGISQRTFYNYFSDKYELIASVYTNIHEKAYRSLGKDASMVQIIRLLVTSICEYSDFYINVVKYKGQNDLLTSIFQPLRDSMYSLVSDVYGDELTDDIRNAIDIYIFGCNGYMQYHLMIEDVVPAETTIQIFEKNAPEILRKYM